MRHSRSGFATYAEHNALTKAVEPMQPGQPYKQCPTCGLPAQLDAPQCGRCGHTFRTKFAPPPDQTQAFVPGDPSQPIHPQTQMGWQQPQSPYPRGYQQGTLMNSVIGVLRDLPSFVCFLIGFFTNMLAIILMVFYFGYAPTKDYQKGWATVYGFLTPMVLWMLFLGITMLRH